jgi:hypothetical protein
MPKFSRNQRRFVPRGMSRAAPRIGPSQLKTNLEVRHQYRFISTSATPTAITDQTLICAAGVSAYTAVAGSPLWQSVKVMRIEMFAPPSAQGAAVTCSVTFPATSQSQSREITDTSVSVSNPAHVVATPPLYSLCSFFQTGTNGTTLFSLVAPPGTIIDVWISLVMANPVSAHAAGTTAVLVGATIGNVYYCSLDSSTSAGSLYKPTGLTTL